MMRDDSTYTAIDSYGTKKWFGSDKKLHREDGPAIIFKDNTRYWIINGKIHREDGPALINHQGTKYWYLNNNLHREDGPAIIWEEGKKQWYVYGIQYDKTDSVFNKAREKYPERFI